MLPHSGVGSEAKYCAHTRKLALHSWTGPALLTAGCNRAIFGHGVLPHAHLHAKRREVGQVVDVVHRRRKLGLARGGPVPAASTATHLGVIASAAVKSKPVTAQLSGLPRQPQPAA